MKKNAPLAFRIPGKLKTSFQQIADREARSISQICEILLTIGAETYSRGRIEIPRAGFINRFRL